MAKDPVCGMEVDESGPHKLEYRGRVYHFCNLGCQKSFAAEPEKYLKDGGQHPHHP